MCEAFFIWFSHYYSVITEVLPGRCLGQGVGSPSLSPLSYPQGWGSKGEASPDDAWIFCCAPPFLSFGGQRGRRWGGCAKRQSQQRKHRQRLTSHYPRLWAKWKNSPTTKSPSLRELKQCPNHNMAIHPGGAKSDPALSSAGPS